MTLQTKGKAPLLLAISTPYLEAKGSQNTDAYSNIHCIGKFWSITKCNTWLSKDSNLFHWTFTTYFPRNFGRDKLHLWYQFYFSSVYIFNLLVVPLPAFSTDLKNKGLKNLTLFQCILSLKNITSAMNVRYAIAKSVYGLN